jgi:major membrane immunogen (membrane-anchored lipoprotein)
MACLEQIAYTMSYTYWYTEERMGLKDDFKKASHTLVEAVEKKGKEIKAAASKAGKEVENAAKRAVEKAKHATTGLRK